MSSTQPYDWLALDVTTDHFRPNRTGKCPLIGCQRKRRRGISGHESAINETIAELRHTVEDRDNQIVELIGENQRLRQEIGRLRALVGEGQCCSGGSGGQQSHRKVMESRNGWTTSSGELPINRSGSTVEVRDSTDRVANDTHICMDLKQLKI